MVEFQAGIRDRLHKIDALLEHSLWQDAIATGHGVAGVAENETELLVKVSCPSQGVGGAMAKAVERHAATALKLDSGEIAPEVAGEIRHHLPALISGCIRK